MLSNPDQISTRNSSGWLVVANLESSGAPGQKDAVSALDGAHSSLRIFGHHGATMQQAATETVRFESRLNRSGGDFSPMGSFLNRHDRGMSGQGEMV